MLLKELLANIDDIETSPSNLDIDVSGIAESLQDVAAGNLFACVVGASHDGHDNAAAALEAGATTLLVQRLLPLEVPQVMATDVRAALAPLAANFYGHPDQSVRVAGVTGTNGKTTVTHMLAEICEYSGLRSSVIGTLSGAYTTPPALKLQADLAAMRDAGVKVASIEVSSAGLVQHRADAITFAVAVFTNLTQDHLDYHGTMENYFEAKALLFEPGRANCSVINVDDEYGRRLLERVKSDVRTFSLKDVENLDMSSKGSSFQWHGQSFELPLVGHYNVSNALAAASAAEALGMSTATIAAALNQVAQVPGRLEAVSCGQPFGVVVDFAHTPDGLANVLGVLKQVTDSNGRVVVVVGCGGDRDAGKRPQMGAIAAELADQVVITSDNPRSEDPAEIADQMQAGALQSGDGDASNVEVILDRRAAIQKAIESAGDRDVVVIAGKGHETTQEIAGVKYPFDDRLVAEELLGARGFEREGVRS